jgi:CubicO group peptidase (beta-lactamase class C family)
MPSIDLPRAALDQLEAARVPGVVVALVRAGGPALLIAHGTDARGARLSAESLMPVASVTKLATALAVLRLADQGRLHVDDPLYLHLPEALAAHSVATIAMLLSHSAGMPLDLAAADAPYAPGLDWPQLGLACLACLPEAAPGERVQYSNVGYGLLGLLVERLTGLPFGSALRSLVLEPLGVEGYLGEEPPRAPAWVADVRGEHAGTAIEPFNSPFWRSLALPWAGLVTTAAGALALVRAFQGEAPLVLSEPLRARAVQSQTGDLGGGFVPPMRWERAPWGLGPEIRGVKLPHWLPLSMPDAYGHAGASGTLAWYDPGSRVAFALLGMRSAESGWLLRRGPALVEALVGLLDR